MLKLNKELQEAGEGSNTYEKIKSEIEKTDKKLTKKFIGSMD